MDDEITGATIRITPKGVGTSCVESNVGFHESFDPSSEFDFVLCAEDVDLLRGKGDGSGGSGRGRNDFEDEFGTSRETDFSRWTGWGLAFGRGV